MNQFRFLRKNIKEELISNLKDLSYIKSFTIVGSFNSSNSIDSISDIDTVIIIDKLTEDKFNEIISRVKKTNLKKLGLADYSLNINSTFGPLKFDSKSSIVFHLMIYDIDGHINHVENSPFTCFDWELSKPILGLYLKQIYRVGSLQLNDIISSRRGLESYLNDIEEGVISYRENEFLNNIPKTVKKKHYLDSKHILEYSYHITKNLLLNFYKVVNQKNISLEVEDLLSFYRGLTDKLNDEIEFVEELNQWKRNKVKIPKAPIKRVKKFISNFFSFIKETNKNTSNIYFFRHARTPLNDGSFLGVGRDPDIIFPKDFNNSNIYNIGYSSSLLRSKNTLKLFSVKQSKTDERINEINYGELEGKNIFELKREYKLIYDKWDKMLDPRFPGGENQQDVIERLEIFLSEELFNNKNKEVLVITHLVVMRALIKLLWDVEIHLIHRIKLQHLSSIDLFLQRRVIIPNLNNHIRKSIRENLKYEF